jgi:hypothetical protein
MFSSNQFVSPAPMSENLGCDWLLPGLCTKEKEALANENL